MTIFSTSRLRCARSIGLALLMAGVLSACQKELYRDLNEQDANEMVVVLLQAGIDAEKVTPDGGKTWSIKSDGQQVVQAMEVLRARGLPQQKFSNLGDIFKKDGLVSTPTQERVRFIYGVSQEISNTLSQIDGVVNARVHIVLPNNDPLAQRVEPSSASVFIKYRPDANIASLIPQIKNLVSHSVEGLSYEQVSVTTVPADPISAMVIKKSKSSGMWIALATAAGIVVLSLAGLGLWLWQNARRSGEANPLQSVIDGVIGRFRKPDAASKDESDR